MEPSGALTVNSPCSNPTSKDTQAEAWDSSFDNLIDFGSPKADAIRHTALSACQAAGDVPEPFHDDLPHGGGTYSKGPAMPDTWGAYITEPYRHADIPARTDYARSAANEQEMQRQIDELREVVSSLVSEKQQGLLSPCGLGSQPPGINAVLVHSQPSHPSTPVASDIFGSFSFDRPPNKDHGPADGYSTPPDPLTIPFDVSDDSPIYSRRSSACSIGSLSSKRGPRISGGYACTKCDSRFDVPSELRHHKRKHLSKIERPHACTICGDRFLYPKDVSRHERKVHSVVRPELPSCERQLRSKPREAGSLETPEGRKPSRRHRQQARGCLSRRTVHIQQFESEIQALHSNAKEDDSRRDSAIADMGIISPDDEESYSLILTSPTPDDDQPLEKLLQQLAAQQNELRDLGQALQLANEARETLVAEQDAFADIFSSTAVFPDLLEDLGGCRPSTVNHARSWLGAIEALLSSAEPPDGTHESQITDALKLLASALDNVNRQK